MAFSSSTMQNTDWAAVKHFSKNEFAHPEKMGVAFVMWLDQVRATAGVPMYLSSTARTKEHNAAISGAKDSAHVDDICNAADIRKHPTPNDPNWNFARWQIIKAAIDLGCRRIGLYPNGSIHLDRTEDKRPAPRLWVAVDNPAS